MGHQNQPGLLYILLEKEKFALHTISNAHLLLINLN